MDYRADMDLDSWVDMFDRVFSPTQNYERTDYQIFERLTEQFSGIAKYAAKKPNRELLGEYLSRAFSWLCALCTKTGNPDLEQLVWNKFPAVCAYCAESPCRCGFEKLPAQQDRLDQCRRLNRSKLPKNINDWQVMFKDIYLDKNLASLKERLDILQGGPTLFGDESSAQHLYELRVLVSLMHLVEELGELGRAMRNRYFSNDSLRDEIADMFAWLLGAANIISMHTKGFSLQEFLWKQYPQVCGLCRCRPCRCAAAPNESLVDEAARLSAEHDQLTEVGGSSAWHRLISIIDGDRVARKRASPFSLIVFDLNDFKSVNERPGGHPQGDEALRTVGTVLKRKCAEKHVPFRLGGDEFAVVIFKMTEDKVSQLLRDITEAISASPIKDVVNPSQNFSVSISGGYAFSADGAETLTGLYHKADSEQAKAKQAYRTTRRGMPKTDAIAPPAILATETPLATN